MSELRWNPLLGTWTIVAANRQNRPNMPKDYCPFCPGEGKFKTEHYDVCMYPNDYPALSGGVAGDFQIEGSELYQHADAKGHCEVILYSSEHERQLYELSDEHVAKLVHLWVERFRHYRQFPLVRYVYEFENRGREVGVTMPHPHGQLYAFPFVPLKIETELHNAQKYYQLHQKNLFEEMISVEQQDGRRVIFETEHFIVFLPYFTDFPYGVFIVSKIPVIHIDEFNAAQQRELGIVMKKVNGMFDHLFGSLFPYMMCMHQGALNSEEWTGQEEFYRFHIEYYPPLRAPETIKYYASAETGGWAATNTRNVEDTAIELRKALEDYLKKFYD